MAREDQARCAPLAESRRSGRKKGEKNSTSFTGGEGKKLSLSFPFLRAHPPLSLHSLKTGIPEVEAPDYSSDSPPPPSSPSGRPRAPGTTPLGARPRRGAGGSASSFSSVSSYSSDDEARASVRRQERVLLDAWTGVGGEGGGGGGSGNGAPAASVPLVGGASALLLLALLLAAGPPS